MTPEELANLAHLRRARDLIGLIEDLEKRGIAFKALNQGFQLLCARRVNCSGKLNSHSVSRHACDRPAGNGRAFGSVFEAKQHCGARGRRRDGGNKAAAKADVGDNRVHGFSLAAEPNFDR